MKCFSWRKVDNGRVENLNRRLTEMILTYNNYIRLIIIKDYNYNKKMLHYKHYKHFLLTNYLKSLGITFNFL